MSGAADGANVAWLVPLKAGEALAEAGENLSAGIVVMAEFKSELSLAEGWLTTPELLPSANRRFIFARPKMTNPKDKIKRPRMHKPPGESSCSFTQEDFFQ